MASSVLEVEEHHGNMGWLDTSYSYQQEQFIAVHLSYQAQCSGLLYASNWTLKLFFHIYIISTISLCACTDMVGEWVSVWYFHIWR